VGTSRPMGLLLLGVYLGVLAVAQAILFVVSDGRLQSRAFVVSTAQGNVTFRITQMVSIDFTVDVLDFGQGFINSSCNNCTMETTGNGTADPICCQYQWATPPGDGLLIENTGTTLLNLFLQTSLNASDFIGGSLAEPSVQYMLASEASEPHDSADGDDASSSCLSSWYPPSFTEISVNGSYACGNATRFDYTPGNTQDEVHLLFRIVIPEDAPRGSKSLTFLATATAP